MRVVLVLLFALAGCASDDVSCACDRGRFYEGPDSSRLDPGSDQDGFNLAGK